MRNLEFNNREIEYLKALKTLGMRCLVMTDTGKAFASEYMLKINDAGTGWKHETATNPFAKSIRPDVLNRYTDDWKTSLVDLEELDSE
jgi:hypothetical protein